MLSKSHSRDHSAIPAEVHRDQINEALLRALQVCAQDASGAGNLHEFDPGFVDDIDLHTGLLSESHYPEYTTMQLDCLVVS